MVLQGPRDDVVTQVEDEEADDEQRAHAAPHGLPVPVQSVSSHSLQVAFESVGRWGEKAWIIHAVAAGSPGHTSPSAQEDSVLGATDV